MPGSQRRQVRMMDGEISSAFADAADGHGQLSAVEKAWVIVGPDRVDYVKDLLDQSDTLPLRTPPAASKDQDTAPVSSLKGLVIGGAATAVGIAQEKTPTFFVPRIPERKNLCPNGCRI